MSNEPSPFTHDASSQSSESINPYAATVEVSSMEPLPNGVEEFRRLHLSHEASVKTIGFLYLLGAAFLIVLGAMAFLSPWIDGTTQDPGGETATMLGGGILMGIGILQGFTGIGLRKLQPWSRIVAAMFCVPALFQFSLTSLISIYFLYLFLSRKGKTVFSASYKEVIAETPDIKYKVSKVVWFFVGLLLFVIALGIVGLIFGAVVS